MYLVEIDNEGNVKNDVTNDGWKGITVFRNLVEKHGIKAFNFVALTADYETPYKHYSSKDRPIRVMEEIYGNRKAIDIEDVFFKEALSKYNELQFNADLQQERIFNDMKYSILERIEVANQSGDYTEINRETSQLHKHEDSMQKFKGRFDRVKAIQASVTNSGYELTRIENEIKSRKNDKFSRNGKGLINPNKLGLEDQNSK